MNRKKRNLNNTVKKHRNKVRKVRTRGKHKKARLSRKHKSTQKLRRSMNNLAGSLKNLGSTPKTSILDKILTIPRRSKAPKGRHRHDTIDSKNGMYLPTITVKDKPSNVVETRLV